MLQEDPKIGKHVLDLLTTGMYKEPCLIYREYIQNSADQIDLLSPDEKNDLNRCRIVIDIDRQNARVKVKDFATGVPQKDFKARLLNIADSWKDPAKDKGFRGIGRLAGLAYCHKLIFETSAKGERVVSRMEMDGDEMRSILGNRKDRCSASELIKRISTITQEETDIPDYECYFTVTLEGIIEAVGGGLLEVEAVRSLIEQIAPLPFSETRFKKWKIKIDAFAAEMGHPLQTYSISINGNTIVKPYKNVIIGRNREEVGKINDVVFRKIKDQRGKVLAWAWAAVPDQGKQITESTNPERMMRLRKDNIQIGMEDFFNGRAPDGGGFFSQARANGYMLGEVHIIEPSIRPNADRNNLEVSEIASKFLTILKESLFTDLWNAAEEGNRLSKARENIEGYAEALKQKREKIENPTLPYGSREALASELETAFKKAADGLALLKRTKGKLSKTVDDGSAMDLLRHSKTADIDQLETLVIAPPKPSLSPQPEPDTPPDVPPPKPKSAPKRGKPPFSDKPSPPVTPLTEAPSLGDKVIKILCDSGLDIEKAIDVWTKIEEVLPR